MGETMLSAGNTKRYDIPLAHLDYAYVKSCSNVKELEKILKILRSGDEGCYPELEKLTEERITELAPESRVLRKEIPASRLSDLDSISRSSIQEDIENWNLQMRSKEEEILTSGSGTLPDDPDLPPIRSGVIGSSASEDTGEPKKTNKRVKPRDYREWDKVNVDKELEKVDQEEEERTRQKEKMKERNGLPDLDPHVSTKGMTEEEKLMKANREKDKGNEAFLSGDYEESVLYYTRSISVLPTTASYNNRALAYLKMEDWENCLSDLKRVLQAEPDNIKGLLRRGTAYKGKKDYQKAAKDFKKVLELEPKNKKAKDLLDEIEADVKKAEKEKEEKKAKGRRMVIEEVEGSDDEEESEIQMNGQERQSKEKTGRKMTATQPSGDVEEKTKEVDDAEEQMKDGGKDIWKIDDLGEFVTEDKCGTEEESLKQTSGEADLTQNGASCAIETEIEVEVEGDSSEGKNKDEDAQDKDEGGIDLEFSEVQYSSRPVFHKIPLPEDIAELREEGNGLFRTGQYAEALIKYEYAINKLDSQSEGHEVSLSLLYSNQAACKLKTGDCSSAIADCTMALDLVPHSIKPLLRRASAFEMKEKYRKAYADYKHVLSIDSSVHQAHQGATRCQGHLKEEDGAKWRDKLPPLVSVFPWEIPDIIDPNAPKPHPQAVPSPTTPSHTPSSQTAPSQTATQQTSTFKAATPPAAVPKNAQPSTANSSSATAGKQKTSEHEQKDKPKETLQEKFDRCKSQGNEHVKKSEFGAAIRSYSECIETLPDVSVAYSNRALCYLKLNKPKEALSDCDQALRLEPENIKALYRRAQAKKMLEQYKESLADLLHLLQIEPGNKAAKSEVEIVKKLYKKEFDRTKSESKSATKEVPSKQRKKMKIVEVDDDDDDDSPKSGISSKSPPKASSKSTSKTASESTSPQSSSSSSSTTKSSPHTQSSKKARKSKSKVKATSDTGLPVAPPGVPKLEKATPYEFLQAWNSLKSAAAVDPFTELLLQVQPEDLPKLISNKLDGQMLHKMIGCVKQIVAKGEVDRGYNILKYLCQVDRFRTIQMFMSAEEKKEIGNICGIMSRNKTSVYNDEDIAKLRKSYSS